MVLTICFKCDYPERGRFKYIEQYRHMFGQFYDKEGKLEWQLTPQHIIEIEMYALGFLRPNYPVPSLRS